jgi:RND family efflux transporter MFP subunit
MTRQLWVLLVFGALAASGCGKGDEPGRESSGVAPVAVRAMVVATQSAEEPIQYSATIEPAEEASIAGKIMGRVERILVSEGDAVRKGQLLVKLEGGDVRAKLAQAEAGVVEATVHFENAKKNLERFESLFQQNAATQKELDDVRVGYESARARLRAAEEMKREVEELLQYVDVVAPFDGVVTKTHVDAGDLASPGQPIISLENARRLEVVASVPESQIEQLSIGMPVKIVIPSQSGDVPDQEFTGSIDQIVPTADPGSHQFVVKVFIQNPGGTVRSGIFARLVVSRALAEQLMVPAGAIHRRGQLEGVYIVDDDARAHLRWIRTGRTVGEWVEVIAGLEPGETVVTWSAARLKDSQRVEVAK